MKLTSVVRLQPTDHQYKLLLATLEAANAACNAISDTAWEVKQFGRVPVHRLTYAGIREAFNLTAQLAVRCIGKVVDAYKLDKNSKRVFNLHGAVPYDSRILAWKIADKRVSIWTLAGRETIPFACSQHHYELLKYQRGESDLVYRKGKWFLYTTCEVPEDTPMEVESFLGVDLGIANIAVTSDNLFYQGKTVKSVRYRHRRLRAKLQKKGTKSAKRRLKRLSGKERRFASDVNHCISKRIVQTAKDTGRGIALENLKGISFRVTVRRSQRTVLKSWAFNDLQQKITYKAKLVGIPVVLVDPCNSSRTCPACGHVDKANRPAQDKFLCTQCGRAGHADYFASVEISRRAAVNPPNAVHVLGEIPAATASLRL